jgi:SAM-dependent methyltransferase
MILKKIGRRIFPTIDSVFLSLDKEVINRTNSLQDIPAVAERRGGKHSYAEWAYVIGVFQTLMFEWLKERQGNKVLDIGCGTGLLGLAAKALVAGGGKYTGIDVMKDDIDYCKAQYGKWKNFDFVHFDLANPTYASNQSSELIPWPIEDNSQDLVTALSVWTHLNEEHSHFYMKEVYRVLKPGGRAIITFFVLDKAYEESLAIRSDASGRFHGTKQTLWVFDQPAYDSKHWYTTKWAQNPEYAMAQDKAGYDELLKSSGLKQIKFYQGNWKEQPGLYFQDVAILEK